MRAFLVASMVLLLACPGGTHPQDGGTSPDDAGNPDDAGTDAGTSADAGTDAGFFGDSRCAGSGLAVCEDFEDGHTFDGGVWHPGTLQGTVEVDTSRAARGTSSLHVHVADAAKNHAVISNASIFPDGGWPGNHFFGRTFFWLEPSATPMHNGFITASGPLLLPDGGHSGQTAIYGVHETLGNFVTHYSNSNAPGDGGCDCGVKSTEAIPVGHWACIEWEFDGPGKTARLWVDEAAVPSATITPEMNWVAPHFETLTVGFNMYHTTDSGPAAYDLWYDALALDSARIGCRR